MVVDCGAGSAAREVNSFADLCESLSVRTRGHEGARRLVEEAMGALSARAPEGWRKTDLGLRAPRTLRRGDYRGGARSKDDRESGAGDYLRDASPCRNASGHPVARVWDPGRRSDAAGRGRQSPLVNPNPANST